MIRMTVLYPNTPGAKFDLEYYTTVHMPLVEDRLKPLGLIRTEICKGVAGRPPDDVPPPYVTMGYLYFNSLEECQNGFAVHGKELIDHIRAYTDIEPQFQISEIVKE